MRTKGRGLTRGDVQWDKLIPMIIAVIVFVIVVLAIASQASGGVISNLLKLIPDFIKSNYTVSTPAQCPSGYAEIGYIDKNNYIILNGKKTNLYVSGNEVLVAVPLKYDWGRDQILGNIKDGVILINFPENIDQTEIEYRSLYPEVRDRRLLLGAKIYEGTLCLPDNLASQYANADKCVLTCSLVDGVCSNSPVAGKISFKQLDCEKTQLCYVDETDEKISTDKLSLVNDEFHSEYNRFIDKNGQSSLINNVVSINALDAILFEKISLKLFTRSKSSYCYSFDSDKVDNDLMKGYQEINDNNKDPNMNSVYSNEFSYSGDRFIQFVAWNNENQKIIKRWKFNNPTDIVSNYYFIINTEDKKWFSSSKVGEINNGVVKSSVVPPQGSYLSKLEQTFYNKSSGKFYLIKDGKTTDTIKFTINKQDGKEKIYTSRESTADIYRVYYTNLYLSLASDDSGQVISNNEFAYKVNNAPIGSALFVIGLKKDWNTGNMFNREGKTLVTYDYKIVRISKTSISIEAHDVEKEVWHKLYCSKGSVVPDYNLKITKDMPDSLSGTFDKYCMWSYL